VAAATSASVWDKTFGCGFRGPRVMSVPAAVARPHFLPVSSAEGEAHEENKSVLARLSVKPRRFVVPFWSPLGH